MTNHETFSIPSPSRRNALKVLALGGIAVGLAPKLIQALLDSGKLQAVCERYFLMGNLLSISSISSDPAESAAAIRHTYQEMARLCAIFDHRLEGSPLHRLNAQGILDDPPSELVEVLHAAEQVSNLSVGAFDVTIKPALDAYRSNLAAAWVKAFHLVDYRQIDLAQDHIRLKHPGMAITLDGIAKGMVIQSGLEVLRRCGFENVLVEAGGDLTVHGATSHNEGWKIGIQHPRRREDLLGSLRLLEGAAATSGDYQFTFSRDYQHHHILDPRTGMSPPELSSVSVLAPSATEADALSTAIMVMGVQHGLALAESLPGIEALLITKNMSHYCTEGFPQL